jgi:pimeloyl-ACP methyl ester carboxylesterase
MYCLEKGNQNGQTIVFIHGGGMAGWMWKKQWDAFQDYHLLIPDLPDHGKSKSEGAIDIQDSAERVATLIREKANGGRAHVVGHSLGAKIIVQVLASNPELVNRAVVASALFRNMPLLNLMLNMPAYLMTVRMLKNKAILDMQARQFGFPDEEYEKNFKLEAAEETAEMLERIYTQLQKYQKLPQGLDQAETPTLIVCGEKEPNAMRESALDLAKVLPNGRALMVCGAKHNFPWAQHDAFNHAIRAWLTGLPVDHPLIRSAD